MSTIKFQLRPTSVVNNI